MALTKRVKRKSARRVANWELRLYVAGKTPTAIAAFQNLKHICDIHLKGQYRIEVVDLLENPTLARGDQIIAVPTLVRKLPPPVKKILGNLANEERVLVGLDLLPLKLLMVRSDPWPNEPPVTNLPAARRTGTCPRAPLPLPSSAG